MGLAWGRPNAVEAGAAKVKSAELIVSPLRAQLATKVAAPALKFVGKTTLPLNAPVASVFKVAASAVVAPFCVKVKLTVLLAPGVPQVPETAVVLPAAG